jgi:hypothetical protein
MQSYSPPTILAPVLRTPTEAKEYFSHYPLIEAKSKSYRVKDARGEGVLASLRMSAPKQIDSLCWLWSRATLGTEAEQPLHLFGG